MVKVGGRITSSRITFQVLQLLKALHVYLERNVIQIPKPEILQFLPLFLQLARVEYEIFFLAFRKSTERS